MITTTMPSRSADNCPWTDCGPEWQVAYWARKCGVSRSLLESTVLPRGDHDMAVAEWIDRCAARLGTLRPYMSPIQALSLSIELHAERAHIPPEYAADLEFVE